MKVINSALVVATLFSTVVDAQVREDKEQKTKIDLAALRLHLTFLSFDTLLIDQDGYTHAC